MSDDLHFYGVDVTEGYEVICEATLGLDGILDLAFVVLARTAP